jgi:multicomponent Na+:H+ antiporter subunit E
MWQCSVTRQCPWRVATMRKQRTAEIADEASHQLDAPHRSAVLRGAAFFIFWLVLIQSLKLSDIAIGAGATACATWVSLYLLPPATGCLRFGRLLLLLPHFVWQSVRAGVDVARRAFTPALPLQPGMVRCPLGFGPGLARNTFASITSLLPGTVSCDEVDGVLVYHCIDTDQPVLEQLWQEERLLARALVAGSGHG